MVPLDSSQLHEHDGGLGFLIGEGLSVFVCLQKEEEEELGERERERQENREETGNEGIPGEWDEV